ncbi:MAG: ABC transporter permease [Candidatus Aminicenantes bacterium]|nr:ABC transporter permease [Candidatus Aminicenantes bacterium]
MKKILAVIKREYLQIIKTKGFIIGTLLGPVLMAAFIVVPILVSLASVDKQETIGVIDKSRQVFSELESKLDFKMKDGSRRYVLQDYTSGADSGIVREELNRKILNGELSAYIYIPHDVMEEGKPEYVSEHVADFEEIKTINQALNGVVIEKRLETEGLDPKKVAEYIRGVEMRTIKVTKKGTEEDRGGTFLISYFLVLILYMTLFFYGSIIMRGVIEEKNSRMVEIVLSSLKPFQLMMGKILGIGAVGFTQYSIWALFGIAATRYSRSFLSSVVPAGVSEFSLPSIPAYIFVYFLLFFILGFFLFGTLYAAIASMVNSEKEAQQLLMPVSMFLVIPILLMMFVMRNPDSTFSVVLSLIPFFAPILMLLRVCILLPPAAQLSGSILLLILTILFMIWLAAKIYRVGILMYGKAPNLREIVKWVRYS